MQLQERLTSLLESIDLPAGAESELYAQEIETRTLIWGDKKLQLESGAAVEGLCARTLQDGRHALVTTTSINASQLSEQIRMALDMARYSPLDPHRIFSQPRSSYPGEPEDDAHILSQSSASLLSRLRDIEKRILEMDGRIKKIVKLQFVEKKDVSALVNTLGVSLQSHSTQSAFVVEVLAEEGSRTEVAWDYRASRFGHSLLIDRIAEDTARHALRSLESRPISSGSYAALIPPRVGTQLLGLVAQSLSAESVQQGRSFLAKDMGAQVMSPLVTIIDDPLLPDGMASSPFDDEGTPHRTLTPVLKGVLKSFFYDLRSASRDKKESTGHGIKAGLSSIPSPQPTNFYISAGSSPVEELLSSDKRVFVPQDVMGLHTADPVTGEFSLGASGDLYENGAYKQSVRGVTIAGRLETLFKSVAGVGNDLSWFGSFGAPSLLVSNLTVAGV